MFGFPGVGGNLSMSLKSIEFSEGGFHFKLGGADQQTRKATDQASSRPYMFWSVPGAYGVFTQV